MKTGTSHFPSYGAALRYYRYAVDAYASGPSRTFHLRRLIDSKLNASEISIGKPALKPGETLAIEDNRYFINDSKP